MQLSVKNVEDKIFREFKAESVRDGLKVGRALTLAMKFWLERISRGKKVSILNLKPRSWGRGTEKASEEIDRILY